MTSKDRRKAARYESTLDIQIRFLPDGTPIQGQGVEIGPNGMRVFTTIPLVEASYIHISFQEASNNTHCEGRVVWTQRSASSGRYESGIDIQRWGGDVPETTIMQISPTTTAKKDRRSKPR